MAFIKRIKIKKRGLGEVPMALATAKDLAQWMGGELCGREDREIVRVHTDSRTALPGDAFVALKGRRWDGHQFILQAIQKGASVVVVETGWQIDSENVSVIRVSDTLQALQAAACAYRAGHRARWIAVTGSSGKTTTKELIRSVLGARFRVAATQGNQNNHIGVPLTVLQVAPDEEFAVVELGTNHPGEIAFLAELVRPQFGVITGIGPAHIEFFGSLEAIAREKTDLWASLPSDGWAVANGQDVWLRRFAWRSKARMMWVGGGEDAVWVLEGWEPGKEGSRYWLSWHGVGKVEVFLPFWGGALGVNVLLAAALGGIAGLSLSEIAQGLERFRPSAGRMELKPSAGGWVLDDSYNANPQSVEAALEALARLQLGGRRGAVLGTMGELGEWAAGFHRELGKQVGRLGLDWVVFVGEHGETLAQGAREVHFPEDRLFVVPGAQEALEQVRELFRPGDLLLVKGSRAVGLERVVEGLDGSAAG